MKKFIFFAAAALMTLAACTKVESSVDSQKVIDFKVANYRVDSKVTGVQYNGGNFGTYAWFNGSDVFMVNEKVSLSAGKWTTADHTFYWPKTGSIDFISYSPFAGTSDTAGSVPAVTSSTITYTNYTVGTDDLMYADKATCSSNVNEVNDGVDSGFTGVPTFFHHALAKVSFKIKANFLTWGEGDDVTTWVVKVTSLKLTGLKTTGTCALTWDTDHWTRPTGDVWTSPSGATAAQELLTSEQIAAEGVTLTTTPTVLNSATGYVLPQELAAATQTLTISYTIKTTNASGHVINETITNKVIDLKDISSLTKWKMNDNIVYTINIKPTASAAGEDAHNDDPEDVIITFDPAVADWTTVEAAATIQI